MLSTGVATAQTSKSHTISGYVTDGKSQETLLGASVYDAATMKGSVTNNYGYYTLNWPMARWISEHRSWDMTPIKLA